MGFDVIASVEEFIKKRDNGYFIFTDKATQLKYLYNYQSGYYDGPLERAKHTHTLAACLSMAIKAYLYRDGDKSQLSLAVLCYHYIDIAWNVGALRPSEQASIKEELTKIESENEQLRQKLADLSDKYLEAIAELEKWHNHFPHVKDLK